MSDATTDFEHPKRRFCALLDEAIEEEHKAPADYDNLQLVAMSVPEWNNNTDIPVIYNEIAKIISDEQRHHEKLLTIKNIWCK